LRPLPESDQAPAELSAATFARDRNFAGT